MSGLAASRWFKGLAVLLIIALVVTGAAAQDEGKDKYYVGLVARTEAFAAWLANYPNYVGYAYQGEHNVWYVEFYDASESEWLGYANVDGDTRAILDSFIPAPLPDDEYNAGRERIQTLVLQDPEVVALLGDPTLWDVYTDFNRWERVWELYVYRGLDSFKVSANLDEYGYSINGIHDQNKLNADQELANARNTAINLAWGAPGIDTALAGVDDWRTYVEHQGYTQWSVSFVSGEKELFYALVDVENGEVLESAAP